MAVDERADDIELMQYLDGELAGDEAERVSAEVASGDEASDKARALGQVGETVRTYAELETDAAESDLARVWARLEERLGAAAEAEREAPPPSRIPPVARGDDRGMWGRLGEWLDGVRGHFITGGVAAAAAAALVLALVGDGGGQGDARGVAAGPPAAEPAQAQPAALESQPPEVESLELYSGSGTVLTLPGDEAGDGAGTAVIWLEDEVESEGPI